MCINLKAKTILTSALSTIFPPIAVQICIVATKSLVTIVHNLLVAVYCATATNVAAKIGNRFFPCMLSPITQYRCDIFP